MGLFKLIFILFIVNIIVCFILGVIEIGVLYNVRYHSWASVFQFLISIFGFTMLALFNAGLTNEIKGDSISWVLGLIFSVPIIFLNVLSKESDDAAKIIQVGYLIYGIVIFIIATNVPILVILPISYIITYLIN